MRIIISLIFYLFLVNFAFSQVIQPQKHSYSIHEELNCGCYSPLGYEIIELKEEILTLKVFRCERFKFCCDSIYTYEDRTSENNMCSSNSFDIEISFGDSFILWQRHFNNNWNSWYEETIVFEIPSKARHSYTKLSISWYNSIRKVNVGSQMFLFKIIQKETLNSNENYPKHSDPISKPLLLDLSSNKIDSIFRYGKELDSIAVKFDSLYLLSNKVPIRYLNNAISIYKSFEDQEIFYNQLLIINKFNTNFEHWDTIPFNFTFPTLSNKQIKITTKFKRKILCYSNSIESLVLSLKHTSHSKEFDSLFNFDKISSVSKSLLIFYKNNRLGNSYSTIEMYYLTVDLINRLKMLKKKPNIIINDMGFVSRFSYLLNDFFSLINTFDSETGSLERNSLFCCSSNTNFYQVTDNYYATNSSKQNNYLVFKIKKKITNGTIIDASNETYRVFRIPIRDYDVNKISKLIRNENYKFQPDLNNPSFIISYVLPYSIYHLIVLKTNSANSNLLSIDSMDKNPAYYELPGDEQFIFDSKRKLNILTDILLINDKSNK